ncbi:MAG TPA: hypothetical protein VGR61_04975 [Candidatus Dormibacteraeota bacterium]|nr:hypothetical protein [Candidatus Dormibacteraeota bacterium]
MTAVATREQRRRHSDQPKSKRDMDAMQLYAMPPGESLQRLRSDFVALDKMLATMAAKRFTGYLRVHSDELNGVVLLVDGGVVETLFDIAPVVVTGQRALGLVAATVAEGEGELDIVPLDAEVVMGIYQLLTAPTLYENLFARFVDVPGLLEYLSETGISGSVIVTNGEEQGVILLREGNLLTAYTSRSMNPESAPEMLMKLCQTPTTEIEVRASRLPESNPRMELTSALSMAAGRDLRQEIADVARRESSSGIPRRLSDADFEGGTRSS